MTGTGAGIELRASRSGQANRVRRSRRAQCGSRKATRWVGLSATVAGGYSTSVGQNAALPRGWAHHRFGRAEVGSSRPFPVELAFALRNGLIIDAGITAFHVAQFVKLSDAISHKFA